MEGNRKVGLKQYILLILLAGQVNGLPFLLILWAVLNSALTVCTSQVLPGVALLPNFSCPVGIGKQGVDPNHCHRVCPLQCKPRSTAQVRAGKRAGPLNNLV